MYTLAIIMSDIFSIAEQQQRKTTNLSARGGAKGDEAGDEEGDCIGDAGWGHCSYCKGGV